MNMSSIKYKISVKSFYLVQRTHPHKIHDILHITMCEVQDVLTCYEPEMGQNQYVHHKLYNGVYGIVQMQYLNKKKIKCSKFNVIQ